jgi:hypothetical protein
MPDDVSEPQKPRITQFSIIVPLTVGLSLIRHRQSLVTLLLKERVAADRTYRGEQIDSLRRLLKRFQPGDILACPPYDGQLGHLRSFFYKFRMLHFILSSVPVSFVR